MNLWVNRLIADEALPEDSDRKPDGTLKVWPSWLQKGRTEPHGPIHVHELAALEEGRCPRRLGPAGPGPLGGRGAGRASLMPEPNHRAPSGRLAGPKPANWWTRWEQIIGSQSGQVIGCADLFALSLNSPFTVEQSECPLRLRLKRVWRVLANIWAGEVCD